MRRISQVTILAVSVVMINFCATANAQETKKVTVHVKGVACPFCVYNIEKRIKTLKAVSSKAKFKSNIKEGTVSFDWDIAVPFSAEAIARQVRKAGFTPGKIEVVEPKAVDAPKSKTPEIEVKPKAPAESTLAGVAKLIAPKQNAGQNAGQKPEQNTGQIQLFDTKTGSTFTVESSQRVDRQESHRALLGFIRRQSKDSPKAHVKVYGRLLSKDSGKLILHRWEPLHYAAKLSIKVKSLACAQCSRCMMIALDPLKGVLHVEANFKDDIVELWMRSASPDTKAIGHAINEAGREVIEVLTSLPDGPKAGDKKSQSPVQNKKDKKQRESKLKEGQ